MLLFNTTPTHLAWAETNEENRLLQSGVIQPEEEFPAALLDAVENADQAVYLLESGGLEISEEAADLTPGVLNALQNVQKYAPYENSLLMKAVFHMVTMRPDLQHILLCNTAFFQHMPQAARQVALPDNLRQPEIQRYGAGGLYHHYAWEHIRQIDAQQNEKIITVHLDDYNPSVAAIQRGVAVECSAGFGKLEGIAGLTTCGSIDPSLPLLMVEDGQSVDQALQILTTQSGLQTMDADLDTLRTLYTDRQNKHRPAREKLQYQLLKQIGSAAAIMNGVQKLVFLCEDYSENQPFLLELLQSLAHFGVKVAKTPSECGENCLQYHTTDSAIQVYALQADTWQIMAHFTEKFTNQ